MFLYSGFKIYGYACANSIQNLDLNDVNLIISERYKNLKNCILNIFEDDSDKDIIIWLLASDRKINDSMILDIIKYILDNDLIYDYLLMFDVPSF